MPEAPVVDIRTAPGSAGYLSGERVAQAVGAYERDTVAKRGYELFSVSRALAQQELAEVDRQLGLFREELKKKEQMQPISDALSIGITVLANVVAPGVGGWAGQALGAMSPALGGLGGQLLTGYKPSGDVQAINSMIGLGYGIYNANTALAKQKLQAGAEKAGTNLTGAGTDPLAPTPMTDIERANIQSQVDIFSPQSGLVSKVTPPPSATAQALGTPPVPAPIPTATPMVRPDLGAMSQVSQWMPTGGAQPSNAFTQGQDVLGYVAGAEPIVPPAVMTKAGQVATQAGQALREGAQYTADVAQAPYYLGKEALGNLATYLSTGKASPETIAQNQARFLELISRKPSKEELEKIYGQSRRGY